jgi:putative autotransporter adhesin-like protein
MLRFALAGSIALAMASGAMAESRDFELSGFDQVDIHTGINATVTLGDSFSVRAESANKDLLDKLEVTLDSSKLSASVDQSFLDFIFNGGVVGQLLGANELKLTITLPKLAAVSVSSAADVEVVGAKGDLDLNVSSGADLSIPGAALGAVRLELSSGSDTMLSGTCDTLTISASSGSDLKAGDLKCATATVDASSGSDVAVFANKSIKVEASSGSDVEVSGNPPETAIDSSSGADISLDD